MKEDDLARKYYEKSLKINPVNPDAKKMLEEIKKKK